MPAPTSRAALGLLRQAGDGLAEAHREADPLLRYPAAYLAALRAAAAVLAVRAAAEAGIARLVGRRDADDLLRQAEQFVGIVRGVVPVR